MSSLHKRALFWALIIGGSASFFLAVGQVDEKQVDQKQVAEKTAGGKTPIEKTANDKDDKNNKDSENKDKSLAVKPVARVSSVTLTEANGGIDVEISTTRSVTLRSQVTSDPDRLILDFADALPGAALRNQAIDRGQVKGIRVGLFTQNPPVTRVVIDLKSPQPYRIFPSGKTVIVKLTTGEQRAAAGHLNNASYTPPPAQPAPTLAIEYKNGRLSILAEKVSLAQVLGEVQRKIGADIPVPPLAAQEQVIVNTGLLPVRDALTSLLNGSRFNFIIVGADGDPSKVKSVILSYRGAGGMSQPVIAAQPQPAVTESQPEPEPPPQEMQPQPDMQPPQPDVPTQPEAPQPQEGQPQEGPPPQEGPQPQ